MRKSKKADLESVKDLIVDPEVIESKETEASRVEHHVWAEPQLFLVPFCIPQKSDRFRSVEIVERVKVDGETKERRFRVNPDPKYGLPGSFELEIMLGIYQLAAQHSTLSGDVPNVLELGSINSFLKIMGRPYSGKYAAMVKEGLKRLASTTCVSEGFFYSKPRNLYIIKRFGFITEAQIAGEENGNGGYFEKTSVTLDPVIVENLNARFRTLVDAQYVRGLKTDIAKALTFHLSYRFHQAGKHKQSYWDTDYSWLAPRLGIRVYKQGWEANKQMRPALEELKASGFISSYEWLSNMRLRFYAGPIYVEHHQKRVEKRDMFLAHQETIEAKQLSLLPALIPEREKVEHDPLAPLCSLYSLRGWTTDVAERAQKLNLDQNQLDLELKQRGFAVKV